MRKFLKNIGLLCALVCGAFLVLTIVDFTLVGSQYQESYNASLVDKMRRLEEIESPKIVLIGNSNLAFGIDSKMIEDALGMPVVNMGYLGSMGNAFHEEMIKNHIGKGDLVVLSHTTFSDDDRIPYVPAAWITLDCHTELYSIMRPKDWFTILMGYPNYLRNAFMMGITGKGNKDTNDSYSRTAFNHYGDVVRRLESGQMDPEEYFAKEKEVLPEINEVCIKRINELDHYIDSCGGTLVVVAYPIAFGENTHFTDEDIQEFQKQLETGLECDIISKYTDYLYPYELFYDQIYHLTENGAILRTRQ